MAVIEDHVVGWLCFIRLNKQSLQALHVPASVLSILVERGWLAVERVAGDASLGEFRLTPEGNAVTDLAAPEWGIDPL